MIHDLFLHERLNIVLKNGTLSFASSLSVLEVLNNRCFSRNLLSMIHISFQDWSFEKKGCEVSRKNSAVNLSADDTLYS